MASCRCGKHMLVAQNEGRCVWCGHEASTLKPTPWRQVLALAGLLLEPERKAA